MRDEASQIRKRRAQVVLQALRANDYPAHPDEERLDLPTQGDTAMQMNSLLAAALIGTGMTVRIEHGDPLFDEPGPPKRKAAPKPVATEPEKVWPETRQQRRYRERKGL